MRHRLFRFPLLTRRIFLAASTAASVMPLLPARLRAQPDASEPLPPPVFDASSSIATPTSITLVWSHEATDIERFDLRFVSHLPDAVEQSLEGVLSGMTIDNLTPNCGHSAMIRAVRGKDVSNWSDAFQVCTRLPQPAKPSIHEMPNGSGLLIRWNFASTIAAANSKAIKVRIAKYHASQPAAHPIIDDAPLDGQVIDVGLVSGALYRAQFLAPDPCGLTEIHASDVSDPAGIVTVRNQPVMHLNRALDLLNGFPGAPWR